MARRSDLDLRFAHGCVVSAPETLRQVRTVGGLTRAGLVRVWHEAQALAARLVAIPPAAAKLSADDIAAARELARLVQLLSPIEPGRTEKTGGRL